MPLELSTSTECPFSTASAENSASEDEEAMIRKASRSSCVIRRKGPQPVLIDENLQQEVSRLVRQEVLEVTAQQRLEILELQQQMAQVLQKIDIAQPAKDKQEPKAEPCESGAEIAAHVQELRERVDKVLVQMERTCSEQRNFNFAKVAAPKSHSAIESTQKSSLPVSRVRSPCLQERVSRMSIGSDAGAVSRSVRVCRSVSPVALRIVRTSPSPLPPTPPVLASAASASNFKFQCAYVPKPITAPILACRDMRGRTPQ